MSSRLTRAFFLLFFVFFLVVQEAWSSRSNCFLSRRSLPPPRSPSCRLPAAFQLFLFFLEKQVEKPSKIQPKVRDLGNGRRSPKAVAKLAWKSCGGKISAQLASLVSFVLQCHERVDVRSPNMEEAVKK